MKKCSEKCVKNNINCNAEECKYWIDFKDDHNCMLIAIDKNGSMSLREVGKRMGLSYVCIKQIQDKAIDKLYKRNKRKKNELLTIIQD